MLPSQIQFVPAFKMLPPPVGLFLYISKLVQLQNPTLIMSQDTVAPTTFCSGGYFPIVCYQYPSNDPGEAVRNIQVRN